MQNTEPPSPYRWVIVALTSALDMGVVLAAFSIGILLPDMTKELEMSPIEAGWLGSTFWMAIAILSIPSSIFLSRFNPKMTCILVAIAGGITVILQGLAPNYLFELLARILFVSVVVIRFQAAILLIQQWFEVREIIKVSSIQAALVTVAQVMGVALIPSLLVLLNGWRGVYVAIGVLLIGIGLTIIFFMRENITHAYHARLSSQDGNPLGALKKYRLLWIVSCVQLGSALTWTAFITFWPTFLITFRDIPLSTAGFLMSLFPLGSILGSFSSNLLSMWLGRRKPILIIPGLLLPFTYLAMVYGTGTFLLGFISFFTGYLVFVIVPIIMSYPYEMPGIKPREVAVGMALNSTVTMTGGSIGPVVSGFLQQSTGSLQTALAMTTFLALSIAIASSFLPETGWRALGRKPTEIATDRSSQVR